MVTFAELEQNNELIIRDIYNCNLEVVRGDYYDGIKLVIQKNPAGFDLEVLNLNNVEFCCEIYDGNIKVTDFSYNVIESTLHIWLTNRQTAQLTKTQFPKPGLTKAVAYDLSPYKFTIAMRQPVFSANILNVVNGRFRTLEPHELNATSEIKITDSVLSAINNVVYTDLVIHNTTEFTIPVLSTQTSYEASGNISILKRDTLVVGKVLAVESKSSCWSS